MAQQDGSEAITVVIQKLTEIVAGTHGKPGDSDRGSQSEPSDSVKEVITEGSPGRIDDKNDDEDAQCNNRISEENAGVDPPLEDSAQPLEEQLQIESTEIDIEVTPIEDGDREEYEKQTYMIIEEDSNEHLSITVETTEEHSQQDLDKENEGQRNPQIVFNLPPGFSNLSTNDSHKLIQTLMQLSSSQDVSAGQTLQVGNVSQGAQVVETIGAEMVVPTTHVYEGSHVTIDSNQDTQQVVHVLPTESQSAPTILNLPVRLKQTLVGKTTDDNVSTGAKKEVLKCAKCDYCSHNKHYLKQHVDLVHNADRPFKCPFCDYAGKRSHSLKEHLVVHSTNRPFECPICNASFRKKGHLTNHVKLHNTFKYFECGICLVKFIDRTQLYNHLRTGHDPSTVYECKVCEYATTIKSNIVMHMHTHGNPEVYRCTVCSFTALHINILRQHMQTHSENKANLYNIETQSAKARPVIFLKCSVCGYTTDKKEALQSHMWQHLPEETSKEFTSSAEKKSTESESPNKEEQGDKEQGSLYKCTECSYSCKEAYLFITHMLAHHPRQKLIADQQKQQQQQKQQESGKQKEQEGKETMMAFTHDSAAGMYRCTICGYMCEQQRTIKAHIWKHSGHKDIDYPMFQNGPISVYDDTPVGKAVLLSEKSKKPPIKVIPRPTEEKVDTEKQEESTTGKSASQSQENKKSKSSEHANSAKESDTKAEGAKTEEKVCSLKTVTSELSGAAKITAQPTKQTVPQKVIPGAKVLRPVFANQPIRWAMQSLDGTPRVIPVAMPSGQAPSQLGPRLRLVSPLPTTLQPIPVGKTSSASSSPEIVRLILGSAQGGGKPTDVGFRFPNSVKKRRISTEHSDEKDAMVGVAKRICLEEMVTGKGSSTGNVVVQQVSQIYTTPTITISTSQLTGLQAGEASTTSGTPAQPPSQSEETSSDVYKDIQTQEKTGKESPESVDSSATDDNDTMDTDQDSMTVSEVVVETRTRDEETSNEETEAVSLLEKDQADMTTLVRLLKKGPNYNPACQATQMDIDENSSSTNPACIDTDPSDADSENAHSEESKRKKGICSSLLAVIEQLRERSKSESEGETKSEGSEKRSGPAAGTRSGGKRKSRNSSVEDETPIESYTNVEKIHSNPSQYRCKLCHYSSYTTNVIKNHMRLHKTKQPFECSLCDHQADSSESLQEHMLQHCKVRTYHCKVCTAVFNYKSQLRAHMRAHNEKEPFLCDFCDYETANPLAFRNHSRTHAEKKEETVTAIEVIAQGKSVESSTADDPKELSCDECDFVAESASDLKLHVLSQHQITYKCDQCEQECTTWNTFSNHLKMHLEMRTLKCELCDFVATSTRSLKSHMKRHVNDQRFVQQPLEQYKCNLCGYVCHHLPSLKSHMWRHASDKNYSYQLTNDVINAAIDYDTNPTVPQTSSSTSPSSLAPDSTVTTSSIDTKTHPSNNTASSTTTTTTAATSTTVTSSGKDVTPQSTPVETPTVRPKTPASNRPCLVTFRCCQCGFESVDKSVLNDHMKTHLDIIRKTLEVNKSRLVARAMKEIGHSSDKEGTDCEKGKLSQDKSESALCNDSDNGSDGEKKD